MTDLPHGPEQRCVALLYPDPDMLSTTASPVAQWANSMLAEARDITNLPIMVRILFAG